MLTSTSMPDFRVRNRRAMPPVRTMNVAAVVPLSAILKELGREGRWIPHPLAKPLLSLAFAVGISSFPVAELDFIRYVCMVDGRRATAELGFRPRFGLRETIRAVDEAA